MKKKCKVDLTAQQWLKASNTKNGEQIIKLKQLSKKGINRQTFKANQAAKKTKA